MCDFKELGIIKTFFLNSPIENVQSNNSVQIEKGNFALNQSGLIIHQSLKLNFSNEIRALKDSDDNLMIFGGNQTPTIMIILASTCLNIFLLLIYAARQLIYKCFLTLGQNCVIFYRQLVYPNNNNNNNINEELTLTKSDSSRNIIIDNNPLYPNLIPKNSAPITRET